jgi:uncharacterized protein YqgV (UPF0045/DUF77 family)
MTDTPINNLDEAVARIEKKMDNQFAELSRKQNTSETVIAGKISILTERVKSIDQHIDDQEFITRCVLVAMFICFVAFTARLLGFVIN